MGRPMDTAATGMPSLPDLSVFKGLPAEQLDLLQRKAQRRTYRHDEIIFREGDPPAFVYFILTGEVSITLSSEDRRVSIGKVPAGQLIGLQAIFDDGPHYLAAMAARSTTVLAIPKEDLVGILRRNPSAMFKFAQILAKQGRLAAYLMAEVQFLDLPVRLAKRLLELAERNGEAPAGAAVDVRITQKELSELAGATRGGVNRALKRLEDLGLIGTGRGKLQILAMDRLRQLASRQDALPAMLGAEHFTG